MAATYPKVVGRMVYTRADFRSWIRENEAVLNGMGMRLNKVVYKEVYRALSERRDDRPGLRMACESLGSLGPRLR